MGRAATASVLEAALEYARLGYRVLPVKRGAKAALLPGWQEAASTDPDVITDWWRRWPRANVAIHAGGLVVLNLDRGWDETFLTPERKQTLRELNPPVQRTPNNGYHVLFRRPDGVCWRQSAGKLARGVDVKTAQAYIVAAPSRVGGRPYRWVRPLLPPTELPSPPQWLAAELDRIHRPQPAARSNAGCAFSNGAALPRALRELGPIHEGARHSTLIRVLAACRACGPEDEEIQQFGATINSSYCCPPLPWGEVAAIVRWIQTLPVGSHKSAWRLIKWTRIQQTARRAQCRDRPWG